MAANEERRALLDSPIMSSTTASNGSNFKNAVFVRYLGHSDIARKRATEQNTSHLRIQTGEAFSRTLLNLPGSGFGSRNNVRFPVTWR
jgi:hypothetical protein